MLWVDVPGFFRTEFFYIIMPFKKNMANMMDLSKTKKGIHKSRGGLIRSFLVIENGKIKDISISGDFFLFPEDAIFIILEHLKGTHATREEIQKNIESAYESENIQAPGTTPLDFTEAIMKAVEG
jgi:lipoate-protein ligase A